MAAVPAYGIDGLAFDDLTSRAEEALATHNMMRTRSVLLMVSVYDGTALDPAEK
jgi:hypothetical protein